jgi:hypothetical protein
LFIQCIFEKSDESISEWRGMNWKLQEEEMYEDDGDENPLQHIFDWETYFYQYIPKNEENDESVKILRRIVNKDKWQSRLKKRSIAFF